MKFLVDGMLGGLAKWLRILGQTVEYDVATDDNKLLKRATEGNMILLTCDQELSRRATKRRITCLLLHGDSEPERLAQVARTYGIALVVDMATTKCPMCGGDLRPAEGKSEVAGRVPRASLEIYDDFWICARPGCEKVYWKGSHWGQIHKTLESTKRLSDS